MDVFAAVADPVRRDLLGALAAGPARVVDLAADRDISRPAVSRHLRLLSDAGLATGEDRGRERHYRLAPQALVVIREWADRLIATPQPFGEAVLDGLALEVRRTVRDHRRLAPHEETG